jgi:hypothetical protein
MKVQTKVSELGTRDALFLIRIKANAHNLGNNVFDRPSRLPRDLRRTCADAGAAGSNPERGMDVCY